MNLRPLSLCLRLSAFASLLASPAVAALGDLDDDFKPNINDRVITTALQGGGKILIGGEFNSVAGTRRDHLARLNADGSLDTTFDPGVNGDVTCIAVMPDESIFVGGDFTKIGDVTRSRFAKLNAGGALDTTFNPNVGGGSVATVYAIAVQPDGKVLIGGGFTSAGGSGRNRIARFNADGTLDTAFNPGASGPVRGLALQADGKIIVAGQFGTLAGVTRNRLGRLNADGTIDTSFNPNMNNHVSGVVVQQDGKILVGGEFTAVGSEARGYLARLTTAGALDTGFDPKVNAQVRSIAVQADGKIVVGGDFTTFGETSRSRLARLDASGAVDENFNPGASNLVYSISLQADGAIVAGGIFTSIKGQTRNRMARIANDTATQDLTVPSVSRVQWTRSGALPDPQNVVFDVKAEGAAAWTILGNGARITGGWELTGITLPAAGEVRARARTTSGQFNGSPSFVEETQTFAFLPEINVEYPAGTSLESGSGAIAFGSAVAGSGITRTFTVKNTGVHNLTGLGITFEGGNAADFAVISPPSAPVAAGGSTSFIVRFLAATTGTRTAVMKIASNDADENPFIINLNAAALDPGGDEDGDGMSNAAEVLLSASGFDPLVTSTTLITQLRASGLYLAGDVHGATLSEPVLERDPVSGTFRLKVGLQTSPNLIDWTNIPGELDFLIPSSGNLPLFYRLFGKKP